MRVKVVFAITGFVLVGWNENFAQIHSFAEQALSYGRIQPGGDARIRAMGGAQTSLGGDISSAYYNPAGLGMYNRSDFSVTPGYTIANSSSSYFGNQSRESNANLIVPNIGIAFHTGKDGSKGLWGGTFAINFNRVNDFNNTFSYSGTNQDNSIIDYFIDSADGKDSTQFQSATFNRPEGVNYNTSTGLAYNNYLIGPASELNSSNPKDQYFSYVPLQDIVQREVIKTTGSQNQWSVSYGVNFNDRIFIGAGLGLASFTYKTSTTYTETYTIDPLKTMELRETLDQSGNGINATLGLIARPVDQFQVGFSVATPTSYEITESYSASMSSSWNHFEYFPGSSEYLDDLSEQTDVLTSTYTLSTPWRFSGGITFFVQKHGLITADAEYFNYGSTRYSDNDLSSTNTEIKNLYKSTYNIRLGGEYRLNNYRFRAGYSVMPDPYQVKQNDQSRSLSSFTTGVGYRTSRFYVDLGVVLGQGNSTYRPYPFTPPVTLNNKSTSIIITVGFPF